MQRVKPSFAVVITLIFLVGLADCLNHRQVDNLNQLNGMNHKLHLQTNQITSVLQHQVTDRLQNQEQHNINGQHNQEQSEGKKTKDQGCSQQQTNKAQTAIQGCQQQNMKNVGTCMNKFLNTNPKQKWDIFIIEKGKPDDIIIPKKKCLIKRKLFGNYSRDYYLWPQYEPKDSTTVQLCHVNILFLHFASQRCRKKGQKKDITQVALCMSNYLKPFYGTEFNLVVRGKWQRTFWDRKQLQDSYLSYHSFTNCSAYFLTQQPFHFRIRLQFYAWVN